MYWLSASLQGGFRAGSSCCQVHSWCHQASRLTSPTLSKAKEPPGAPEDSGSGPLIPLHERVYALLYCLHKSWRLGTCCAETTTYPNEECNCLEFGAGFFSCLFVCIQVSSLSSTWRMFSEKDRVSACKPPT